MPTRADLENALKDAILDGEVANDYNDAKAFLENKFKTLSVK